jgi:predicted outer membrane repeat protein
MKKLFLIKSLILMAAIASAQIIHVPGNQPTIQAGIDAAASGDTVLVDEGIWYENINFNGKAITVASQFIIDNDTIQINNTVIDGSQAVNPDEASVITLNSGEDTTSVISGFSITGGQGTWSGMFSTQAGGGILCVNAGAKIINCKITNNEVIHEDYTHGAGICCMISNGNFNIIIENNTISDNAVYTSNSNSMAGGGGIFIGSSTPAANIIAHVRNNVFNNNYCENENSRADGGAIKIQIQTLASATYNVHHNIFQNNSINGASSSRGGALCGIGTGANIHNNIFRNNTIDINSGQFRGAAICFKNASSDIHIYENQFIENNSPIDEEDCTGAVSIMDSWEEGVFIDRNFFMNNEAYWGAALYVRRGYKLSITNNVFHENSACGGGCISLYNPESNKANIKYGSEYARAGIINNTFDNNSATDFGGAIRFSGYHTPPIIFNSLFCNNTAPSGSDIYNADDDKLEISYSRIYTEDIEGPWSGSNNFPDDPYLVPGDSLCHLSWHSLCIGAGTEGMAFTDTTYSCPDHDYDGEPRPMCELVDVGADETPFWVGISDHQANNAGLRLTINPNPSSGALHLRYLILDTRYLIFEVYSADGVKVKTLFSGKQAAGEHTMNADLSDLPDGLYFIRLQAGEEVETAKLLLIK